MSKRKRHSFWNLLIVLTLIVCLSAFVAHYKNWEKIEDGNFRIFSGIYYQKFAVQEIDSITLIDKLPEMERASGFSWMMKEKGIFRDTIAQKKVYVFVDDLEQQKIQLVHHDSLKLFLNFEDSLQTQKIYTALQAKWDSLKKTK